MAFRFLHTADWQIGMKAAHAGRAAEKVRAARLEAAARVIAIADERDVDAVILAGDTFEDSCVPRDVVRAVADILQRSKAPVYVLPGNHDPLLPKGVFEHLAWNDVREKVTVLRDRAPIACGDADLFPCPLRRTNSVEDPLADLPSGAGPRTRIRVGIAHGSLLGAAASAEDLSEDFPMDRAHAERAWLDYLALGHWHSRSTHDVGGVGRIAYSGTHEPTKFGETGGCLIVSIDAPGATPKIEFAPCAQIEWRFRDETLSAPGDLEALRRQILAEPAESAARVLLDLKLEGCLSIAEQDRLADLETLISSRFLHARLRRDKLRLMPEGDQWIDALPAGSPRATARALMTDAGKGGREGVVAARALALLFDVAGASAR
jgi:DNA repair exonuclease SbcCD nuclease subunit